ncbi:MAG TPA: short chain dehydrogenase [Thermoanaerobaculia bacterium]|jgi:NAD(P)-dependent dehydrogenase (short-subunit alcohol dehydrogenase family)|nr:short chain dehydrogenase [Thermoanaerobaculia bacterium]
MRIIVIGAAGTIGKEIVAALEGRHEIVRVGRQSGEMQVDISSRESIERFFQAAGPFDALVSAAGETRFAPLEKLSDEDFQFCLANKLMGQVNLMRYGLAHVRDGGSFTLTSGVLTTEPIPGSSAISLVNGGLEAFARAAALEMPRGVRVNVVSPPWVTETLVAMGSARNVPGGGLPAKDVARAYVESVEGKRNGETLDARDFT